MRRSSRSARTPRTPPRAGLGVPRVRTCAADRRRGPGAGVPADHDQSQPQPLYRCSPRPGSSVQRCHWEARADAPTPQWLDQVVTALGLTDLLTHRPGELSGVQQQRVACARALAGCPEIVFADGPTGRRADEPTGNLDTRVGAEVPSLLGHLAHAMGQTIVMVTHDPAAAAYADRVVFLADGHVVDDLRQPDTGALLERMKRFDGPRRPQPHGR
ncbi:ATP-binding cassette domain-containing protein [Streptomyces europaeiscabiei]|uniref:ATP-binding cassette domain-containing protein n=1 Tax=Streptomyces europaeiscabiei TaxID=146819 RepID=A0AAJ2UR90_9ACTN|nr:ATP-binding cassette domain-containing protein [Streptomyces europaeiscabiei]MDX3135929.1 ATP-binding cassette domain-containing protein [Streptomyces europaeiscabiei]